MCSSTSRAPPYTARPPVVDDVRILLSQAIYDVMKIKVENVMERGEVYPEYISDEHREHTFNKYRTSGFTRSNHPAIIEVLTESGKEKDSKGQSMPNLV
ncbi:hypothetical protein Tco_0185211, partial [Tanacetum coccineum]